MGREKDINYKTVLKSAKYLLFEIFFLQKLGFYYIINQCENRHLPIVL